ncbi:capsular polysaccharide biosynthesis protein [hydrocarbon metagenome]|uniref:Capsular polysaccharide biosynthesis protein n=1 Tax=hydrocarbon metagenome TaxID=938273 RepID=A0A0W8F194_9ZZZZ
MLHKGLFILAHECGDLSFYSTYKRLVKNQWKPYAELRREQDKQLRQMISFCYGNIPYYHDLFKNLGLSPKNIQNIEDLEKLPILTKDIIKEHWEEFKPVNLSSMKYYNQATGGSTGTPLQYRLSKHDRFLSGSLLYRGWGYGGYKLGDSMVFLAGSSLDVGSKSNLIKTVHEITRNLKKLSSFDMGDTEMRQYADVLYTYKPKFIRGYASSIYFYAQWLEENDISVPSPNAVFTTAEKLFPYMRETIGRVFSCDVFDGYGLNDGGVSAYECSDHTGLHIDTERSVMEVVATDGSQVNVGQGEILSTSLHNHAMPFIRYNTGDIGTLLDSQCTCMRESMLLKDIVGREKEFLITPQGQHVHGAALFNLIFHTLENTDFPDVVNKIKEFQVIQKETDKLTIVFACAEILPDKSLDFIRDAIQKRFPGWTIEFKFVDAIIRTDAGKYRFIINEISHV